MSYFASSHANHETGRGFKLSLSAPKSENEEDSLSPVDRVDGKMTWDEVVKKKKKLKIKHICSNEDHHKLFLLVSQKTVFTSTKLSWFFSSPV